MKTTLTDFKGIVTAPGLLEREPASCFDALNWEFPAPGLVRKRRGFERLGGNAGGPVWKILTSRLMGNNVVAHVGAGTSAIQLRYGNGTGALTALSVVDSSNLTRARAPRAQMALCQRNHYITANEGVARLESDIGASVVRYAGMPRGEGLRRGGTAFPTFILAGTNFGVGYARAYRVTWHRLDADGIELGGAPTTRFVIANTADFSGFAGATASFDVQFMIPTEWGTNNTALTTSYFFRLWGTRTYLDASQSGDDEMFLVAERYLTAAELAAAYVSYVDATPDLFLGASPTLHTNKTNFSTSEAGIEQGIVNEDAPPPVANDVAYWQDCAWYADFAYRPGITVALITTLTAGDQVSVGVGGVPLVLTASAAPASGTDFRNFTALSSTTANIRATTAALVATINNNLKFLGRGVRAHHISTTTTRPGLIFLEATRPSAAPISFTATPAAAFQGFGGYNVTAGPGVSATQEANGLTFSKPFRADAVPPANNIFSAGPRDARILRIFPFRDRLLVFTDFGIYQVTGRTFADFSLSPFDLGFRLMGRELVALCDERVYAWCYEGIVEIDDGGVRVVSTPIEPTIEALTLAAGAITSPSGQLQFGRNSISDQGYAVGYRNQHQVRFHYPQSDDSAVMNGCAFWLSFDTRTRTWARGQFNQKTFAGYLDARISGVVRFGDDLLMQGCWSTGADTYLFLERQGFINNDYLDDTRDGDSQPISSVMRVQFQVPNDSGLMHWQQTVLNFEDGEATWRARPSLVTLSYATEDLSGFGYASQAVSSEVLRLEAPIEVRRAQRLQLTLTHAVAQYAGVLGISQEYRAGARFARKVTP
jgi:hypothetical protein